MKTNQESQSCIGCGMPMRTPEEHAQKDPSKDYCCYCARADGTMRNYQETLEGMAGFLRKTQGIDAAVARKTAEEMMSKLPAWRGKGGGAP